MSAIFLFRGRFSPSDSIDSGLALFACIRVEETHLKAHDVVSLYRLLKGVDYVLPSRNARLLLNLREGHGYLLAAETKVRLEADGMPDDRSNNPNQRERLGRNSVVEEVIGNVRQIAVPGKESVESVRVRDIFAALVPMEFIK